MENLSIELYQIQNEDCIKFTFKGHFTENDALRGIEEWKSLFASSTDEKATLIWHCIDMTGFDNKARISWQQAIKDLKNQIECVWLITESKIIKAGVNLMKAFIGFNIKVIKSENEIVLSGKQGN